MDEACSGTSMASYSLQAAGIVRVFQRCAADPKKCILSFMHGSQNKPRHLFKSVSDFGCEKAYCRVHDGQCFFPASTRADVLVAGFSCKPYTKLRHGRFTQAGPDTHRDAHLFLDILDILRLRQPRIIILENVLGWNLKGSAEDGQTCMQNHLKMLEELSLYVARVFYLDITAWVEASRPRLYLVGVHRDIATSVQDLDEVETLLESIVNSAQQQRKLTWSECRLPFEVKAQRELMRRSAETDQALHTFPPQHANTAPPGASP